MVMEPFIHFCVSLEINTIKQMDSLNASDLKLFTVKSQNEWESIEF